MDSTGKPLRCFDSRGHTLSYAYDQLHRPLCVFLSNGTAQSITTEKVVYGEGADNDKAHNLRGQVHQHLDHSGISTNQSYDFKENLMKGFRQPCAAYKEVIDWSGNPALLADKFTVELVFDALNRPLRSTSPDGSVHFSIYDRTGQLTGIEVLLKGETEKTSYLQQVSYNAKGQRLAVWYGNNTKTTYRYGPKTSRIEQILTSANNGGTVLQDLNYTYDAVGNISYIKDAAQQDNFFNNQVVSNNSDFIYDAVYQLLSATGREHIGQNLPPSSNDSSRMNQPLPADGAAVRNYTQKYKYDAAGNILKVVHLAASGGWTRTYNYEQTGNRLKSHQVNGSTENYSYDAHGNIQNLAHLGGMAWNFRDQLTQIDLGGGGKAYYTYDASGQRSSKVIERLDGTKEYRFYVSGFELYRKISANGQVKLESETLDVVEQSGRIAMIETQTIRNGLANWERFTRYQYNNHLSSSSIELDQAGEIVSYEEYYPFGATAYQAVNAALKSATKRYRFSGLERDEETGLEYHSARYYLPWLGRWLNTDPTGIDGGLNLYAYCGNRVTIMADPTGNAGWIVVIVVVFLLTGDANDANAPGYVTQQVMINDTIKTVRVAQQAHPRHSDWDIVRKGAIMAVTGGVLGPAVGGMVGRGLVGTAANFATAGATDALANRAYEDIRRGEISSVGEYATTAAKGAAIALVTGMVFTGAPKVIQKMAPKTGGNAMEFSTPAAGEASAPTAPSPRVNLPFTKRPNPGVDPEKIVVGLENDQHVINVTLQVSKRTGAYPRSSNNGFEGATEATAIGHGAIGKNSPGASNVVVDGAYLGARDYAKYMVWNGWRGGVLRLAACRAGLPATNGRILGEDIAQALGEMGFETAVIAAKGNVNAPNGITMVRPYSLERVPDPLNPGQSIPAQGPSQPPGMGWEYFTYDPAKPKLFP